MCFIHTLIPAIYFFAYHYFFFLFFVSSSSACFFRGLVLSHLESGHKDEAEKVCLSAVRLAKKSVPEKLEAVVRLQVWQEMCT